MRRERLRRGEGTREGVVGVVGREEYWGELEPSRLNRLLGSVSHRRHLEGRTESWRSPSPASGDCRGPSCAGVGGRRAGRDGIRRGVTDERANGSTALGRGKQPLMAAFDPLL